MDQPFEQMFHFQEQTLGTAVYPDKGERTMSAFNYCVVGLCGEAGELANKWKKALRGDWIVDAEKAQELSRELQDILWYTARAMDELNIDMGRAAQDLLDRLAQRKAAGTIQGSGDQR